jgi:hypothetical protein
MPWWSFFTPSRKVKFCREKPCALMKVATRVVSVCKASTSRSSISFMCSSLLIGMPAGGRFRSGGVSGDHSGAGGFIVRSICCSTPRTPSRYSSIFSLSRPLAIFCSAFASSKTRSTTLRRFSAARRASGDDGSRKSRSKAARGLISGEMRCVALLHETVFASAIGSSPAMPCRGGSVPSSMLANRVPWPICRAIT